MLTSEEYKQRLILGSKLVKRQQGLFIQTLALSFLNWWQGHLSAFPFCCKECAFHRGDLFPCIQGDKRRSVCPYCTGCLSGNFNSKYWICLLLWVIWRQPALGPNTIKEFLSIYCNHNENKPNVTNWHLTKYGRVLYFTRSQRIKKVPSFEKILQKLIMKVLLI